MEDTDANSPTPEDQSAVPETAPEAIPSLSEGANAPIFEPSSSIPSPSDEPAVRLLSLAFGRLERAQVALDQAKPDEAARLRSDALGWANAARRLLNDLGMTPLARSRLGLTLARGESVVVALQRESREREQAVEP